MLAHPSVCPRQGRRRAGGRVGDGGRRRPGAAGARLAADLGARLQRALATERPTSANEPACKALQKAGVFFVNETRVPEGKAWTTWCDNATDYAENGTAAQ